MHQIPIKKPQVFPFANINGKILNKHEHTEACSLLNVVRAQDHAWASVGSRRISCSREIKSFTKLIAPKRKTILLVFRGS